MAETSTETLRRMLDERGIEHCEHEAPATDCIAFFDGRRWHDCWESVDGEVNVTLSLTPEQAIAATLGAETSNVAESAELREQNADLRVELADMFSWLVDYIAPTQAQMWADRMERLGVEPTWGWR